MSDKLWLDDITALFNLKLIPDSPINKSDLINIVTKWCLLASFILSASTNNSKAFKKTVYMISIICIIYTILSICKQQQSSENSEGFVDDMVPPLEISDENYIKVRETKSPSDMIFGKYSRTHFHIPDDNQPMPMNKSSKTCKAGSMFGSLLGDGDFTEYSLACQN